MSNEASINVGLQIVVGNFQFQNLPQAFNANVSSAGAAGPTPGSVLATLAGTTIDISKLTSFGGLAVITNSDPTNFVEICMFDPDTSKAYPSMDLLPGESFVVRLSRNYANEFGAGTGTTGSGVLYKARVDPSQPTGTTALVVVQAFNR